jgi:dTDP-4-amino-4,6-dideoxygalactose transaminase
MSLAAPLATLNGMMTPGAKTSISDLAVFGGRPAFGTSLHVGRPNVEGRERFVRRVEEIFDRRWLTNDGPVVQELERRMADLLGVRHCIAVANATLGLQLAARATGLTGEVIVPSFTFVATAHALAWQGLDPVFVDIDPRTHTLDPAAVERAITPRTSGVLGVHVWGRGCDVEALRDICDRHGLRLLFDAAHALACTHGGTLIGGFGAAEVFSFHATKFFNSFEGGAITTNDDDLAARLRALRNFGYDEADCIVDVGINAKMSEVSAAMGLTSLESLGDIVRVNQNNYLGYAEHLAGIPGVSLSGPLEGERSNYQYVVLELDRDALGISRDQVLQVLRAEGILARRYFAPVCHRVRPYSERPDRPDLPATDALAERVLQLPTGTAVGPAELEVVAEVLRFAVAHGPEIARCLPQSPDSPHTR